MEPSVAITELPWRRPPARRAAVVAYVVWSVSLAAYLVADVAVTGGAVGKRPAGGLAFFSYTPLLEMASGTVAFGVSLAGGVVMTLASTFVLTATAATTQWFGDSPVPFLALMLALASPLLVEWRLGPRARPRSLLGGLVRLVAGAILAVVAWSSTLVLIGVFRIVLLFVAGLFSGLGPGAGVGLAGEFGLPALGEVPLVMFGNLGLPGLLLGLTVGGVVLAVAWTRERWTGQSSRTQSAPRANV